MKIYNKQSLIVTLFLFCIPTMIGAAARDVVTRVPVVAIKTPAEAYFYITKTINEFPQNETAVPAYEKAQSDAIVRCAKLLYDNARIQILQALSEIDNRIAYWQYQKDHPWRYFVNKNPMKWITGPKQEDEVENNLDILRSHQGELYVLLGQLAERGLTFTQGYKDIFLTDYAKGYEWVDQLLDTLVRIKTKSLVTSDVPFLARLYQLQSKLDNVGQFKNDLLSDITETEIPSYLARNWFKGGLVLMGLNYGYNNITAGHLNSSLAVAKQGLTTVVDPLTTTLKDVLTPGWQKSQWQLKEGQFDINQESILPTLGDSYETKIDLAKEFVKAMGDKYHLEEAAKNTLEGLNKKDFSSYEKFVESVGKQEALEISLFRPFVSVEKGGGWFQNLKDYGTGILLGFKLEGIGYLSDLEKSFIAREKEGKKFLLEQQKKYEEYLLEKEKQYSAVGKVVLLIPAVLAAGATYMAYQKLTEKNYGPLRRALVDINSLFVHPSKPLTDEEYGKMLYLIYMLKNQAMKELPVKKNMRAEFIADLERIESPEYSVPAKRAIIEDMFKKYTFLGLIQKK